MKRTLLFLFLLIVLYPGYSQKHPSERERKHTTRMAWLRPSKDGEIHQDKVRGGKLFEYGALTIRNSAQADSMLVRMYEPKSDGWHTYMKEVPTYHSQSNHIDEIEHWMFDGTAYQPEVRYAATYDEQGRIIRIETHYRENGSWQLYYAADMGYNMLGEEVLYVDYYFDHGSGTWVIMNGYRAVEEYNASGAMTLRTWEYYAGNQWWPDYKEEYFLNEDDVIIEMIEYYYDDWEEDWQKEIRIVMELCENNMWKQGYAYGWDWDEEEWYPELKYLEFEWHDFSLQQVSHVTIMINPAIFDDWKSHDDIEWNHFMRLTMEYHEAGMITLMFNEMWGDDGQGEGWFPAIRMVFEYDHLLNPVSEMISFYEGHDVVMMFGIQLDMAYHADGSIKGFTLLMTWDEWKPELMPVVQYSYYYGDDTTDIPLVQFPGKVLSVFPNPATHYIHLDLPAESEFTEIAIIGTDGRIVRTYRAAGLSQDAPRTLDVSGLKAGVYVLRLQGPSGHQSARFIKQ